MGGGEVIKKGWLIKSPPLEGGGMKAWRKRFFMLRSSKVLEYYKNEGSEQKGVINLEDCKTVHSDLSHKKYKFVFDIETKDRIYYLVAQSQEEMKAWVDVLCRICGLSVQDEMEFLPTVALPPSTGTTAGPSISSPLYATTPSRGAGIYATTPGRGAGGAVGGSNYDTTPSRGASVGVPFNERFKPSSEPAMESMYSLAHSVESEVQRQLSGEQGVAAGTPLSEALACKGITRNSSISSASGRESNISLGSDSPSLLSPRHQPASDTQNLYTPVPKKSSGNTLGAVGGGSSSGGGALGGSLRPVPKPRAATLNPKMTGQLDQGHLEEGASLGNRAETLANGYMQPRRLGNYDHLPSGPPRPAPGQGSNSPKQHRSALLRTCSSSEDTPSSQVSSQDTTQGPTYINVQHMADDVPPVIDRRNKPPQPSPPRVDRNLKPKVESENPPTSSDDPFTESPPVFPTRTTSLASAVDNQSSGDQSGDEVPPEFPVRTTSLANVLDASRGEEEFSEKDLPKPTTRTTQYTQVAFDESGRPTVAGVTRASPPPEGDVRRAPIPVPRRVNYSDVDIAATSALEKGFSRQVTLREAEQQALLEKPYVNVRQEGEVEEVDEDTDPGYYTHMRNLTYQEAMEIYNLPPRSIDLDSSDEEDEEGVR